MLQIDYAILHELYNAGCICISVTEPHTQNIFKSNFVYYDNVQVQILTRVTSKPFTSVDYADYLLTK